MKPKQQTTSTLINERIRADKVQLITHEGENIGVVSRNQALQMAIDAGYDLVMLSEAGGDGVPVCKIMDFGKSLYEKKKKQGEAKKHQKVIQVKEIKLRPKIGEHDFQTKINQAVQFMHDGKRVKMTLWFRGRENVTKDERGTELFMRIEKSFKEHGIEDIISEADSKMGLFWSRIYYTKSGK